MKKLLVIGVIVVFVGLAVSPSIYAGTDESLNNGIKIDFIGLNKNKSSSIELSSDKLEEIHVFLNEKTKLLGDASSDEESFMIFKNICSYLQSNGLINQGESELLLDDYENKPKLRFNDRFKNVLPEDFQFVNLFAFMILTTNGPIVDVGLAERASLWIVSLGMMLALSGTLMALGIYIVILGGIIMIISQGISFLSPLKWRSLLEDPDLTSGISELWSIGLLGIVEATNITAFGFKGIRISGLIPDTPTYYIGHSLAIIK